MKKIILEILVAIIIISSGVTTFVVFHKLFDSNKIDDDLKRLCMQYALRDHEKELSPERWEWLKKFGNPNDVEFFYQSCLNHSSCSITGQSGPDCKLPNKEYMK